MHAMHPCMQNPCGTLETCFNPGGRQDYIMGLQKRRPCLQACLLSQNTKNERSVKKFILRGSFSLLLQYPFTYIAKARTTASYPPG